jgi:uncharacterized membrane protein
MNMRMLLHGVWDYNVSFGTDAKLPEERRLVADNAYRYYDIPFEMPVAGAPCMIGGAYTEQAGTSRLLLDHILIEQREAYTDDKLLARDERQAPEGLAPGGAPGGDVLLVKGWTWQAYGVEEALSECDPPVRVRELWSSSGEADGFPVRHANLYSNDCVVLVNVGATGLGYEGRRCLKDFVEAGGRLVILGGLYTLGQGRFAETFMEDIVPVELEERDVALLPQPAVLRADEAGTRWFAGIAGARWAEAPVVLWAHRLTPRDGAEILLYAGDRPAVVTWSLGKGRVTVAGLTALGESASGAPVFWEWSGWPEILRSMIVQAP